MPAARYTAADFVDALLSAVNDLDPKASVLALVKRRMPDLRAIDREAERVAQIRIIIGQA